MTDFRQICPAHGREFLRELRSFARDEMMDSHELAERLSELGGLIWKAIQSDDQVTELLFELADEKLSHDKVNVEEDARLDPDAAEAIMGFDLAPEILENLRPLVPSHEWAKYALFNLALDWVLDQALMRMKIDQKWPFQEEDGFSKP